MGLLVLAWLVALVFATLSIGATCLYVFTGARPSKAYLVVAVSFVVLTHAVLLSHSFEWWRGSMLDVFVDRQWNPIT